MARPPLTAGHLHDITSQQQFDAIMHGARCKQGEYKGPGKYLELTYTQRCPRNCCDDLVCELLSSDEIVEEAKEAVHDLVSLVRRVKPKPELLEEDEE